MIFALAAASNFSSLTVKIVFSLGFSSAGASADDEEAEAEAGAEAAGRAISVMLSFVYDRGVRLNNQNKPFEKGMAYLEGGNKL